MIFIQRIARLVLTLLFALSAVLSYAQQTISFCSWNLQNLGKSKHDTMIAFIAGILKDYDVVALQEVVPGPGGVQAVVRLHDVLNRAGTEWKYIVSSPTTGEQGKERYAFLWKSSVLKMKGRAFLDSFYAEAIQREPYMITLEAKSGRIFTIVNFHAVPKSKQPEQEIKYFRFFPEKYPGHNMIFAGDFNCPQSHNVFYPLKRMGYQPVLAGQRTTLKQECIRGECLASEYDNIFYLRDKIRIIRSGVIPFHRQFRSNMAARKLSDHLPVFVYFQIK